MGVIQVAISTSGKSPIMARTIRMKVERFLHKIIKTSDVENIILQDFARKAAKEKIKTVKERKEFLYSLLKNKDIQNYIGLNQLDEAKLRTLKLLDEWEAITHK
jgi:precorrin-2 dehydrogenase/sirohydrochlorin ferrochelatase